LSEGIRGGSILSEKEQVHASTKIAVLEQISEIELEEINSFYIEKE
jgi:hypothetical protein